MLAWRSNMIKCDHSSTLFSLLDSLMSNMWSLSIDGKANLQYVSRWDIEPKQKEIYKSTVTIILRLFLTSH